jgi:uncharacterized membrane protein SpoIIM required for sporulation
MTTVLSNHWIQKRQPHWDRLTALVAAAGRGRLQGLSRAELRELALLYRQVASDLSTLRQDRTSAALSGQINHLLARAHHIIYSSRKSNWRNFLLYLRDGYPLVFRRQLVFTFAATVVMLASAVAAAGFSLANSHFAYSILGPDVMSSVERHEMWTKSLVTMAPQAASGIMTNNISVSFGAFAGGLLFGAGSLYVMFINGLMLGAVGVVCQQAGMSIPLWSFVAPHGSLELPAIAIAGGAGFRLGCGMLFPGIYKWKDSVSHAGREAVKLVSGVIPMLIFAGTLEAFFSPSSAPVALKFSVGAALFLLLNFWLFRPIKAADGTPTKALPSRIHIDASEKV